MCGRERTCRWANSYVWQGQGLRAHFWYVWQRKGLTEKGSGGYLAFAEGAPNRLARIGAWARARRAIVAASGRSRFNLRRGIHGGNWSEGQKGTTGLFRRKDRGEERNSPD